MPCYMKRTFFLSVAYHNNRLACLSLCFKRITIDIIHLAWKKLLLQFQIRKMSSHFTKRPSRCSTKRRSRLGKINLQKVWWRQKGNFERSVFQNLRPKVLRYLSPPQQQQQHQQWQREKAQGNANEEQSHLQFLHLSTYSESRKCNCEHQGQDRPRQRWGRRLRVPSLLRVHVRAFTDFCLSSRSQHLLRMPRGSEDHELSDLSWWLWDPATSTFNRGREKGQNLSRKIKVVASFNIKKKILRLVFILPENVFYWSSFVFFITTLIIECTINLLTISKS